MRKVRNLSHFIFLFSFLLTSCLSHYSALSAVKQSALDERYPAYAHFLTAELARFKGDRQKAIEEYRKALESDPSSFYLRKKLITFFLGERQLDTARVLIEQTISLFPERSELELILAQLYRNEGKVTEAVKSLKRVIKREPANVRAYLLLFEISLEKKKWRKAQHYAEKLIENVQKEDSSNLAELYTKIGLEYGKAGDYEEGISYLRKAYQIAPDNVRVRLGLGALHEGEEKLEEALKEYEAASAISPSSLMIYHRLGEINTRLDRIDEAISIYKKALQINHADLVSLINLAQLYYRKEEYQKGLKILERFPYKNAQVYYLEGALLVQLGRMDEAEGRLKKGLQLNPNLVFAYGLLVHIYSERGEKEQALSLLNNAVEKSLLPKHKGYHLLGVAYSRFKDYEKSIHYLRKAHHLAPDDDEIAFQLGASYERSKSWMRAVYHLRKAIRMNPENANALNYLGYMFAEKGIRLDEALSLIKKALEIEPENGYFVDSLGWVYYKQGLIEEARRELERAIQLLEKRGEDDPIIREHLGDVYYREGKYGEAREQWEKSLSLDSTRDEVKEKLEKLPNQ
ncbi:MAG TPA: tetratricopeptide repeat protein [Candidatus Omnitrophica bacterium]|nr:tetratricopeptide repeat protein [Candidatus Omnitrophota bacterium]